jgi:hypothetical protein
VHPWFNLYLRTFVNMHNRPYATFRGRGVHTLGPQRFPVSRLCGAPPVHRGMRPMGTSEHQCAPCPGRPHTPVLCAVSLKTPLLYLLTYLTPSPCIPALLLSICMPPRTPLLFPIPRPAWRIPYRAPYTRLTDCGGVLGWPACMPK